MYPYAELVEQYADRAGLRLPDEACDRLKIYAEMLAEWNGKMNLTSITDPEEIAAKHFGDSLLVFSAAGFKRGAKVIDVGTGAGFPGAVMLIARPDLRVTFLDAREKRLTFLRELLNATGLKADLIHARAEDAARTELRETFDAAVARAVAPMPALCEYCLPFVTPGGFFIALKGPLGDGETKSAANAIKTLGGGNIKIIRNEFEKTGVRLTVVTEKLRPTPAEYPRAQAKIAKSPL